MTLQLLHSEFPYVYEDMRKMWFTFYQCTEPVTDWKWIFEYCEGWRSRRSVPCCSSTSPWTTRAASSSLAPVSMKNCLKLLNVHVMFDMCKFLHFFSVAYSADEVEYKWQGGARYMWPDCNVFCCCWNLTPNPLHQVAWAKFMPIQR